MKIPYIVGQEYERQVDLHDRFGGNRQGGMCPCAKFPLMFIFTGPDGEQHGYEDKFIDDGAFLYTGEGQVGDMSFSNGNLALRDHRKDGRHVLLFRKTRNRYCEFLGEFSYIGHRLVPRPDTNGDWREAIVFELASESLEVVNRMPIEDVKQGVSPKLPKSLSLTELRDLAEKGSSVSVEPKSIKSRLYVRNQAVKRYALGRANGVCECCDKAAPFLTRNKDPYLEVHHLHRVSDGGPDIAKGVAAICPTCHRNIHFGIDGDAVNKRLRKEIYEKENA